jgi:hypothetical protein
LSIEQLAQEPGETGPVYMDIISRNCKRINDLITELLISSPHLRKCAGKIIAEYPDESIATIIDRLRSKVN